MKTKAQLIQEVGEDLGLVPINQALEAQDYTRIQDAYEETYARLKVHGLATWASTGDIPDTAVPYVTTLVLDRLLLTYSVPEGRYARIKTAAGQDGENALRNLAKITRAEDDSIVEAHDF